MYLTRTGPGGHCIRLTLEHRAAPNIEPPELRLVSEPDGSATHLEVVGTAQDASPVPDGADTVTLSDRVLAAIRTASQPVSRAQLRSTLRINNNRLGDALAELQRTGRIRRGDDGLSIVL